jgi:hypothetical protein
MSRQVWTCPVTESLAVLAKIRVVSSAKCDHPSWRVAVGPWGVCHGPLNARMRRTSAGPLATWEGSPPGLALSAGHKQRSRAQRVKRQGQLGHMAQWLREIPLPRQNTVRKANGERGGIMRQALADETDLRPAK